MQKKFNANKNLRSVILNLHKYTAGRSIEEIADKYRKEIVNSFQIAKKYREKINPRYNYLPDRDIEYIKNKIINRARAELRDRIDRGYTNINLGFIEEEVDKMLVELKVG